MSRGLALLLLAGGVACAAPLAAAPREYALDPVHTRVAFLVSHAGYSRAIGTFSGITGTLVLDREDWSASRVTAEIPIDTLELGDAKWRERVLDPTFFDSRRHPRARFVSTSVTAMGEDRLRVEGTLELRGVTRPLVLEVGINKLGRNPMTLRGTAGFSARTTLRRTDFGMQKWKNLVGDEVEVLIEVEARRERNREDD